MLLDSKSPPKSYAPTTFGRIPIGGEKFGSPQKKPSSKPVSKETTPISSPHKTAPLGSLPSTFGRVVSPKKPEVPILEPFSPSKELVPSAQIAEVPIGKTANSEGIAPFTPRKDSDSSSPTKESTTTVTLQSTFGRVVIPKQTEAIRKESLGSASPSKEKDSGSNSIGKTVTSKKLEITTKDSPQVLKSESVAKDSGSMKELGTYYPPTTFGSMPTTFGTRSNENLGTPISPKVGLKTVHEKRKSVIVNDMKNGMKSATDDKTGNIVKNGSTWGYNNGQDNSTTPEKSSNDDNKTGEVQPKSVKDLITRQNSGGKIPSEVTPSVGKYASDSEKIKRQNSAGKSINDSEKVRRQNSTSKYASDSEKIKRENSGVKASGNDTDNVKKQSNGNSKYANVQSKLFSPTAVRTRIGSRIR